MRTLCCYLLTACLAGVASAAAQEDDALLLKIKDAPKHGIVVLHVDLPPALAGGVKGAALPGKEPVPAQFVPDADSDPRHAPGTLIAKLPRGGDWDVMLLPGGEGQPVEEKAALGFDPVRMAGLPSSIVFRETGKVFDNFVWNDRVHDKELGSYHLRFDKEAELETVSDGPICKTVRIRARYRKPDGSRPPSQPEAVYDWHMFHGLPLVYVTAGVRQQTPHAWHELHFLELNFPGEDFVRWAGGEPSKEGTFDATGKSFKLPDWGTLLGDGAAIGMLGGTVTFYDGRGGYGTYMHSTWTPWSDEGRRMSTWLWIGSGGDPAETVRALAAQSTPGPRILLTRPGLRKRIAQLRLTAESERGTTRQDGLWRAALAEREEASGNLDLAEGIVRGELPRGLELLRAGELGVAFQMAGDGASPRSIFDLEAGTELMADDAAPFFTVTLRHTETKEKVTLTAERGWRSATLDRTRDGMAMVWDGPADTRMPGLRVTAKATPDADNHAWKWSLYVENNSADWSIWDVVFPQVALREFGERTAVLYPRGPGELKYGAWKRDFAFRGTYPSGWCAMQLMAAYAEAPATGLYFAIHDPFGSTKRLALVSDPGANSVHLEYGNPVPNMGVPLNDFTLGGEAVWQLLRGDWFDAAAIYKAWAREHAKWWPPLTEDGRADTPLWMRELCAWAQTGGAPGECVSTVKAFAQYLGVPAGFHWYNWHQIPFDNDYPHYFPAKDGFAEGVRELKEADVYVMPYINGRLWDTHDKGKDDFAFSSLALPAVAKNPEGKPHKEKYGSKETDGSPVWLGVMCPATHLWQDKVKEIVLRLEQDVGVNGVYIDQIAAASPALCMDPTHGHPLGGGHWWNEAYWEMLEAIGKEKPVNAMLTTECNAEPFVRWMDGYLTWHWQYDGQVPVFPAVYGGTVQMFGRAYRGGETKDLALRMKAGQQLVFGEQIGWLNPDVANEEGNAEFFRRMVLLRWHLRRYFYAGEMARPPKLIGPIPSVRADWQWSGEWWVTTDAVLTGAWRLPGEGKLALLFVNVSDETVTADFKFDGQAYGLASSKLRLGVIRGGEDAKKAGETPLRFERTITFEPRDAFAWELSEGD